MKRFVIKVESVLVTAQFLVTYTYLKQIASPELLGSLRRDEN